MINDDFPVSDPVNAYKWAMSAFTPTSSYQQNYEAPPGGSFQDRSGPCGRATDGGSSTSQLCGRVVADPSGSNTGVPVSLPSSQCADVGMADPLSSNIGGPVSPRSARYVGYRVTEALDSDINGGLRIRAHPPAARARPLRKVIRGVMLIIAVAVGIILIIAGLAYLSSLLAPVLHDILIAVEVIGIMTLWALTWWKFFPWSERRKHIIMAGQDPGRSRICGWFFLVLSNLLALAWYLPPAIGSLDFLCGGGELPLRPLLLPLVFGGYALALSFVLFWLLTALVGLPLLFFLAWRGDKFEGGLPAFAMFTIPCFTVLVLLVMAAVASYDEARADIIAWPALTVVLFISWVAWLATAIWAIAVAMPKVIAWLFCFTCLCVVPLLVLGGWRAAWAALLDWFLENTPAFLRRSDRNRFETCAFALAFSANTIALGWFLTPTLINAVHYWNGPSLESLQRSLSDLLLALEALVASLLLFILQLGIIALPYVLYHEWRKTGGKASRQRLITSASLSLAAITALALGVWWAVRHIPAPESPWAPLNWPFLALGSFFDLEFIAPVFIQALVFVGVGALINYYLPKLRHNRVSESGVAC